MEKKYPNYTTLGVNASSFIDIVNEGNKNLLKIKIFPKLKDEDTYSGINYLKKIFTIKKIGKKMYDNDDVNNRFLYIDIDSEEVFTKDSDYRKINYQNIPLTIATNVLNVNNLEYLDIAKRVNQDGYVVSLPISKLPVTNKKFKKYFPSLVNLDLTKEKEITIFFEKNVNIVELLSHFSDNGEISFNDVEVHPQWVKYVYDEHKITDYKQFTKLYSNKEIFNDDLYSNLAYKEFEKRWYILGESNSQK